MPRDPLEDPLASPSEATIRPARREDAAGLVRMIRQLAAHHGDRATLGLADAEWDVLGAEPWATALVAEAGGRLVGCALVGRHYRAPFGERCLDLGSLFVEPAWRGRGLGRALVAAVLRHAEQLACSRVTVGTTAGNARAQRFYERLGFEPAPLPGPRYRMLVSPELRPECWPDHAFPLHRRPRESGDPEEKAAHANGRGPRPPHPSLGPRFRGDDGAGR